MVKRKPVWSAGEYFLFALYCLVTDRTFLFSCSCLWLPGYSEIFVSIMYYAVLLRLWYVTGEVFLKSGIVCSMGSGSLPLFFAVVPGIGILVPGVFWYSTASAIHFISMCIFSLALFTIVDIRRSISI